MLPDKTTTTGDSLPVMHINAFHIISAEVTIMPETEDNSYQAFAASYGLKLVRFLYKYRV